MANYFDSKASDPKRQDGNSLSPSEKHLEDYIWAHPECLGLVTKNSDDLGFPVFELVARQVKLPTGRVDLIGMAYMSSLAIIELKKGMIDTRALAQLLRYMRDIKKVVELAVIDYKIMQLPGYENIGMVEDQYNLSEALTFPLLIGADIESDDLLCACNACNVAVMLYEYQSGEYSFDLINTYVDDSGTACANQQELAQGRLGAIIRQALSSHLVFRDQKPFDASKAAEDYLDSIENSGGAL